MKTMKHADGKILVGVEVHFNPKTHETISSTPIYAKSTLELEAAEDQMLENFARAILPLFLKDMEKKRLESEE